MVERPIRPEMAIPLEKKNVTLLQGQTNHTITWPLPHKSKKAVCA